MIDVVAISRLWLNASLWMLMGVSAWATAADSAAQPLPNPLSIARSGFYTDVSAQGSYWFDASGQAAVEVAAATPERFVRTGTRSWPLDGQNALWVRFTLPPLVGPDRWYLDNAAPVTDRLSLYVLTKDGWQAQVAGDKIPVVQWPSPERMPTFRLPTSASDNTEFLLRIDNQFSTTPRLRLWRDGDLSQVRESEYLLLGGFFALAALIVVASFGQAIAYRDKVFAWFGGYALMTALSQAALTGMLAQFVLQDNPWLVDRLVYICPMLAGVLALWFVREVSDLRKSTPWLYQTAFWFGVAGIAFLGVFLVSPEQSVFAIYNLFLSAVFVFVVGALALAARRGDPYAIWMLLGFSFLIGGSMLVVLRNLELLPAQFFVLNGPVIGAAVALPAGYWVVQARARKLFVAQARANALESNDPLTGLFNTRSFDFRLPITLTRANSSAFSGGLLVMEIGNIDRLVADAGDEWRDRAVVVAAARLRDLARDVDMLARVGPARFALVIEGPVARSEVANLAARAIARGLQQSSNLPRGHSLQFHVAALLMPEHGTDATELMQVARTLLKQIAKNPSRKVRFPDTPHTSGLPKAFDASRLDDMQRDAERALGPESGSPSRL